ncbi:unnamed protein product, partial [Iphiclides podalirius]
MRQNSINEHRRDANAARSAAQSTEKLRKLRTYKRMRELSRQPNGYVAREIGDFGAQCSAINKALSPRSPRY